jgi:hypothetical protein
MQYLFSLLCLLKCEIFGNAVLIGIYWEYLRRASNFLTESLSASDYEIADIFFILACFIFSTGIGNDHLNSGAFETGGYVIIPCSCLPFLKIIIFLPVDFKLVRNLSLLWEIVPSFQILTIGGTFILILSLGRGWKTWVFFQIAHVCCPLGICGNLIDFGKKWTFIWPSKSL